MGEKRVVVDTNVIVSALIAGGVPQRILQAWIEGSFTAVMNNELKNEINQVLARTKLVKTDAKRRALLGTLFNMAVFIKPQRLRKEIFSDPKDHFLLELAVAAGAVAIVTGDKELLSVRNPENVAILDPKTFCKRFGI